MLCKVVEPGKTTINEYSLSFFLVLLYITNINYICYYQTGYSVDTKIL